MYRNVSQMSLNFLKILEEKYEESDENYDHTDFTNNFHKETCITGAFHTDRGNFQLKFPKVSPIILLIV